MKFLTLKHIKNEQSGIDLDYRKQLIGILESPIGGQGGISAGEMRRLSKVLDKLEKLKDSPTGAPILPLEDAEWELVNTKVQAAPFVKFTKEALDFCDAVEKAPNSKPKEKTNGAEKAEAVTAEAATVTE